MSVTIVDAITFYLPYVFIWCECVREGGGGREGDRETHHREETDRQMDREICVVHD